MKNKIKKIINYLKKENKIPIMVQSGDSGLLADKTALIVGGSGGMGFAIAESFLNNGATVILTGTKKEKLQNCASKLEKFKDRIDIFVLNMNDVTAFDEKFHELSSLFPDRHINILVNAAGVMNTNDFFAMSELEYDSIMNVNAKGVFFMSQTVAKYMITNKIKGHILNISSAASIRPAWTPYQMSKWAVRGFTLGLADMLLPYGIVVNAIAPGPVATEMIGYKSGDSISSDTNPSGRYVMPQEIASMATLMVSQTGDMIVGDTVYMTGGGGTISLHK